MSAYLKKKVSQCWVQVSDKEKYAYPCLAVFLQNGNTPGSEIVKEPSATQSAPDPSTTSNCVPSPPQSVASIVGVTRQRKQALCVGFAGVFRVAFGDLALDFGDRLPQHTNDKHGRSNSERLSWPPLPVRPFTASVTSRSRAADEEQVVRGVEEGVVDSHQGARARGHVFLTDKQLPEYLLDRRGGGHAEKDESVGGEA